MNGTATMLAALALSSLAAPAAFAQNDSCGSPTTTPAWSAALAQHGPFASNEDQIKFTVDFIYKNCSGGDMAEIPQTVIALCNFNKAIVRMDQNEVVCILVPSSD